MAGVISEDRKIWFIQTTMGDLDGFLKLTLFSYANFITLDIYISSTVSSISNLEVTYDQNWPCNHPSPHHADPNIITHLKKTPYHMQWVWKLPRYSLHWQVLVETSVGDQVERAGRHLTSIAEKLALCIISWKKRKLRLSGAKQQVG